jgi:Predicted esterase
MAVIRSNYYSMARTGIVDFTAILPIDADVNPEDGYHKGPFKTIYLLHGYQGNQDDWITRTRIEMFAKTLGFAVIMPAGLNRFYVDCEPLNEYYGKFIGEELVTVTRQMFPLSKKREDTFIGGLSMGGYGAIRNGLKYNKVFSAIIALSSALITDEIAQATPETPMNVGTYDYYCTTFGNLKKLPGSDKDPKALAKKALKANAPRMYLSCGTEDFLYEKNVDYHQHLEKIGYAHTYVEKPGSHTWTYWDSEMLEALKWLKKSGTGD